MRLIIAIVTTAVMITTVWYLRDGPLSGTSDAGVLAAGTGVPPRVGDLGIPDLTCGAGDGTHAMSMAAHNTPRTMAPVPRSGAFADVVAALDVSRAVQRAAIVPDRPELQQMVRNAQRTGRPAWFSSVVGDLAATPMGVAASAADGASRLTFPMLFNAIQRSTLPSVDPIPPTVQPEPTEPPTPSATPEVDGPTYWVDAYPILQQECVTCHYNGGIGPFPLETYEQASTSGDLIRWAVSERIMPPLPADPKAGLPFDDPRIMTDKDRTTLIAWIDAGAPEGDPADKPDIPPAERDPYGPPDVVFDIGVDFTPPADQLDTYRCFVIDPGLQRDVEVSMVDLVPTADEMFHHGILFLAPPSSVSKVAELDAADPGPGYECFGGPGFNSPDWVAMEAVGSPALPYPDGTAKVIPAGSQLVLQLHYNSLNGVSADRTEVHAWLPDAPVRREPRDLEIANFLFLLPPGKKDNVATWDVAITEDGARGPALRQSIAAGKLWRVWGHMHVLGTEFRFDVIKPDGTEIRVLDIPRWDFNWQGAYDLVEPFPLEPGDTLRMTCEWDNSAENQPYVDGQQVAPRTVTWGEGTFDEMCLGGVTLTD